MAKPPFKIGDRVRILAVPPSVGQEMPEETRQIFLNMVRRVLRVDGIGKYGHLELNVCGDGSQAPNAGHHTVWIEPEFVEPES